MTKKTTALLVAFLLLAGNETSPAQDATTDLVGKRVRLITREPRDTKIFGQVLRVDSSTIVLREHSGAPETSVPVGSVARLDVSGRKLRGPVKNAAIGAFSGTMAGVALISTCKEDEDNCHRDAFVAGSVLAVGGALVGFIYGTTHADSWERVNIHDLSVTLSTSGRVLLTANF